LASRLMFDLVRKTWQLPYVHSYNAGDVVMKGTKRLGKVDADPALLDLVPTFAQVPVFMAAFGKLERLSLDEAHGAARVVLSDP
jgi:hypothetical protein